MGCRLWGRTESDTTEATWQQQQHVSDYRKGDTELVLIGSREEKRDTDRERETDRRETYTSF